MNERWLLAILRAMAIAIAIAALVDPAWSIARAPATPLTVIKMTVSDVTPIERELHRINSGTDVRLREVFHQRLPCGPGERCVVLADGSIGAEVPADLDQPFSLIRIGNRAGPNVRLRSVALAAGQHASAAGVARVIVEGKQVIGRRTEIKISDTTALVGSAVVEWTSDGIQAVDVPWWPVGSGPRTLRIAATPAGDESVLFDNVISTGVDVGSERLPVLVFDARSSWGSTFVRRALEDDARFVVEHRARLAPAIASGTANGRLDMRALDAAAVLVVGGPGALTASEVDLIERFVRVRGGTAVLLPERAPSGSAARLFAGEWSERLTAEPQSVGPLKASELLVYPPGRLRQGLGAQEDGHHQDGLVIAPTGSGRIVISTAMDAWRYRDDDGGPSAPLTASAFDRFWRSVAAEGAAAGAPLRLEFETAVGVPGSRHQFTVRHRRMTPSLTTDASAVARCGLSQRAQTIRMWPAGSPAVLRGELPIAEGAACTVEVTFNDARVTRGIAVSNAPSRPADDTLAELERHARASGGVVTDEDELESIRSLSRRSPEGAKADVHPMRSEWFLLPLVGCLSAEWWLRRRTGLK